MPGDESTDGVVVEKMDKESGELKKIIKGGRLGLYPAGMRLYRCSRGVKKPVVDFMMPGDAQRKVKGMHLTYENITELKDETQNFYSVIHTRQYNKFGG